MKLTPIQVKNDCTGHCDNCREELGAWKWRIGESTGCSSKCANKDFKEDLFEFDDDEK